MVVGKPLIIIGAILVAVGLVFVLSSRIPWLGTLPGDIVLHRGSSISYFPVITSIIVSIVLTIVLNVVLRLLWK